VKALEQLVVRARTRVREERARRGVGGRPARLSVRLDDLDAPGPVAADTAKLDDWYDAIVRIVEWSGPLPAQLVARADHRFLADLVRFTHRLECPTTLRTTAAGVNARRADELVDCGLERILVRVAGVSEGVQQAVLGESVADTRRAISALIAARASRGQPLDIALEVPFDERTAPELRALHEEARAVGVDGVLVAAPWRGGPFSPAALAALSWVAEQPEPFRRTPSDLAETLGRLTGGEPGAPRLRGACPVGALRVELQADGSLHSCPFKADSVRIGDTMAPAWKALDAHRAAIRGCSRTCVHPDLSA
jgi:hypothetical protein